MIQISSSWWRWRGLVSSPTCARHWRSRWWLSNIWWATSSLLTGWKRLLPPSSVTSAAALTRSTLWCPLPSTASTATIYPNIHLSTITYLFPSKMLLLFVHFLIITLSKTYNFNKNYLENIDVEKRSLLRPAIALLPSRYRFSFPRRIWLRGMG